ncbi:hypothetical protein HHK36_003328 [Tetracentron sinense]|uniref:Non-specific lipid-transfer protein n=1 Tax=Tetracentron sinense TaxID=13715 RepID=A0A835DP80_TETSI|nr:hypothetical protein HHK36_003328 [Tetracentron sinense]
MVKGFCGWILSLVALALIMSRANGSLCGDAVNALIPCGSFLVGAGPPTPSNECCTSAQKLTKLAQTTATRRALCQCLKDNGPSFGVKPQRAKQLPTLCKFSLSIPISPTVNCNM